MYHLSNEALRKINSLRPAIISKLALSLHCSDGSINRYIRENEANGDLTKYAAVEVLRNETGLPDNKILKVIPEDVKAK